MIDDTTSRDALAKKRFMAMQLMRFTGAGLAILGLLIITGKIDLPGFIGFILVAIGLVDVLIMPNILAKRWKSPLE